MPKSLIMRLRHIMMVAPPAEPGGDGQQQGGESPAGEKTFSQSDVNRIVEDRLRREQAKYADYNDLRAKAAKFDEQEEANKSELQKATEANRKLESQLAEQKHAGLVANACLKHGIPAEFADLVTGDDEESIDKTAEKVAKLVSTQGKPPASGNGRHPLDGEGNQPGGQGSMSIREQIAAAEKKGDYQTSMTLKSIMLGTKRQ